MEDNVGYRRTVVLQALACPLPPCDRPIDRSIFMVVYAPFEWDIHGMKTTIDKAGRVVIPAALRESLGLGGGTELEVAVEDLSIRLTRCVPEPRVERVGGRLVVRRSDDAKEAPNIDVGALIEAERDRWPI